MESAVRSRQLPQSPEYCGAFHWLPCQQLLTSRNSYEPNLRKELHQTSWVISNRNCPSRSDTIELVFGFYNTGGKANLIAYRSGIIRELCDFKINKDTIVFTTYSATPPCINIDFAACRGENVLVYSNSQVRYISFNAYCDGDKKSLTFDSSLIITSFTR